MESLAGYEKTSKVIEYVFVLRSLLGLLALAALSLWQSPYQHHLSWLYTPFGLQVVLYTLGVLIVVVPLVCWLITSFLQRSIRSD